MLLPPDSPWRVPFDGSFDIAAHPTAPPEDTPKKKALKAALKERTSRLQDLQRRLYADDRWALLLVFQAMDAAGKDSTIRAVMSGVDPSGCQVWSFGPPSEEERDHDFLWRHWRRLPERGRIGVFNRSWYEEVLVVRVLPSLLQRQRLPDALEGPDLWQERLESIHDAERHLARSGTVVLKFFLHVGRDEQRRRLLRRIDDPRRNWKFEASDLAHRDLWPAYMRVYEQALRATSRPWAPWYAVPADSKPYMRLQVADVVVRTLEAMDLRYPRLPEAERACLDDYRAALTEE